MIKRTKRIEAKKIVSCLFCPYLMGTVTDDGKNTFRYYCNGYDFLGRRFINKRKLLRKKMDYISEWCDLKTVKEEKE